MKRRFYVETEDARYFVEAQFMQIYDGAVSFIDKPEGSTEAITVLSFKEWLICGLCDSKAIQSIEVKAE